MSARLRPPRRIDFVELGGAIGAYGFVFCLYTSPAHWWPPIEVLRPAFLAALMMFAAVMLKRIVRGQPLRFAGTPGVMMVALFVLVLASPLWALHPDMAKAFALDALKLPIGFVGLVGILRSPRRVRLAMAVGALAAMVPAWNTIQRYRAGIDLVEGYRAAWIGLLANPNALAMVMAMTVPWALLEVERRRGWQRGLFLLSAGLMVSALVTTHSRGGFLGLSVAVVAYALLSEHKGKALAIACAAGIAVAVFAPESFWKRNQTIGNYELDASAQGRIKSWETGFRAVAEAPVLGVGAGGYVASWDRYTPRNHRERAYAAHNLWMQVLVELGAFGVLVFGAMFASVAWGLWRARKGVLGGEARALLTSMLAVFVCGFTGGYAFSWFFFLLLGVSGAVIATTRAAAPVVERENGVGVALA